MKRFSFRYTTLLFLVCVCAVGCNDNQTQFLAIENQIRGIDKKLDLVDEHLAGDVSGSANSDNQLSQGASRLTRELQKADAVRKNELVEEYVNKAGGFENVKLTNVEKIVTCMESLTTIMSHSDLTTEQLTATEDAQNKLIKSLAVGVTNEVESLDKQATESDDFRSAQKLWTEAATLLEYFPATDDPIAEQKYEIITLAHEEAATRIQLKQQQKYNKWACAQIKEANRVLPGQTPTEIVKSCIKYLGPIDTNLLEPLSLNIYSKFIDDIREKLPLSTFYAMAEQVSIVERMRLDEVKEK